MGQKEPKKMKSLELTNTKQVFKDKTGASVAYFSRQDSSVLHTSVVEDLKRAFEHETGHILRICLHKSPSAVFHNMIILEEKGGYSRPHKHPTKEETFHVIEGRMAIFLFHENGDFDEFVVLEQGENFMMRLGSNRYHSIISLTPQVIYHESKPGPFRRNEDLVFAPWSAEPHERGTLDFMKRLEKAVGEKK
jgi:cupin fold WbuC family metalloprotein